MLPLYAFTLFFSAMLLFMVQPMVARLVLPQLGGTPAVWNTCMVFFQTLLLAGYGYTFLSTRRARPRTHAWVHGLVLLLPLITLPIGIPEAAPQVASSHPILWLMGALLLSVGLPFFVLATTNPMLQHWFATSGHQKGRDPYFLYAASNCGSLVGLFGYPFLFEPLIGLKLQTGIWSIAYIVLVLLVLACGVAALVSRRGHLAGLTTGSAGAATASAATAVDGKELEASGKTTTPTWKTRWHWILLALIPSSLMLGVTSHLTTDVASFPLLWVVPLGLYLVTFIVAFSSRFRVAHKVVIRLVPIAVLPVVVTYPFSGALTNQLLLFALNLAAFFVVALACHGELADRRPHARYLTEFYFCLSIGGVLGGSFNALLAPLLFLTPVEYSLALVAGCLVMPVMGRIRRDRESRLLDVALPVLLGCVCLVLALNLQRQASQLMMVVALAVPAVAAFTFARRPVRFGLAMAAITAGGLSAAHVNEEILFWGRGFFGINRVVSDANTNRHVLVHGTTFHGWQAWPHDETPQPCAYYHREGPLGHVFGRVTSPHARVAVTGLGCGTTMAYHQPGWHFTFYEIDPMVKEIAEDPRLFTYLASHSQSDYEIVLGDARQTLDQNQDAIYQLMIMDAFSSDMVPAHLLTREAMQVYDRHLAADGMIAFHVSNRFMDLVPVVHALANDVGMEAVMMSDQGALATDPTQSSPDHVGSIYVVVTRDPQILNQLLLFRGAMRLEPHKAPRPWTDDYCNILGVFRW